jgi:multidrug efflux system membrane fusion protein
MQKYLISFSIALVMVLWVASGQFVDPQSAAVQEESTSPARGSSHADVQKVRGVVSHAHQHDIELLVRGVTEVNRTVTVRTEISGRIVALPLPKGSHVEANDVLCEIAVDSRDRNLIEARAMQNQAAMEYQGLQDLRTKNLQSEIAIAQARTRLESANAAVSRTRLALERTRIRTPFAGTIEDQPVEVGDFLNVGGACATVIETNPILLTGQVAEKDIGHVAIGERVSARLITGETVQGTISFVAQVADRRTRSYRIEVDVPNPDFELRAGITSELKVPIGSSEAHRISPAVLVLDDEGDIGLKIVNDDDQVEFHQIKIISEGPDGIWVAGLPATVRLITVGQEVVFEGQLVDLDITPLTSLVSD